MKKNLSPIQEIANQVYDKEGFASIVIKHKIKDGFVDKRYTIKLLPATVAWEIAQTLIKFSAPIMGRLYDSEEGFDEDLGFDIGIAINQKLDDLNPAEWGEVLLHECTVEGEKFDMESLKGADGLRVLIELVKFALEKNVLDFLIEWLKDMGSKIPSTTKKVQEEIQKEF